MDFQHRLQIFQNSRKMKLLQCLCIGSIIFSGIIPSHAFAQYSVFERNSLGFGLWLSTMNFKIPAAPDSAPADVKGYTEVLPSAMWGVGVGGGLNFNNFGLDIGLQRADASIRKSADIQQNDDPSDDQFVLQVRRLSQSLSILHHPFSFFYYGYGEENGNFLFRVKVTEDRRQWKTIGFYQTYYLLGFIYGFDWATEPRPLVLLLNIYAKLPTKTRSFGGPIYGIGITGGLP